MKFLLLENSAALLEKQRESIKKQTLLSRPDPVSVKNNGMNKRVIGEETAEEEAGKDERERENIKKLKGNV